MHTENTSLTTERNRMKIGHTQNEQETVRYAQRKIDTERERDSEKCTNANLINQYIAINKYVMA